MLRPHHILCAIGWQGHGYSDAFSANMDAVVCGRLRANPDARLRLTVQADAICTPCPKRRGPGCEAGARIAALDARHSAALGLSAGDVLSWSEAQARAARLHPDDLDRLCAGCQWLELGLCKAALAQLRKDQGQE